MSDIGNSNHPSNHNLSWQAFLYVSGEMTDSELAAFEDQLNPDSENWNPVACEAVAESVHLSDTLVRAFDVSSAPVSNASLTVREQHTASSRSRSALWVSLLAPVVAVLAVGWIFVSLNSDSTIDVADQRSAPTSADAVNESHGDGEIVRLWVESDSSLDLGTDEPQLLTAADVPDTLVADVPDWLMIAVQSQQQTADGLPEQEVLEN